MCKPNAGTLTHLRGLRLGHRPVAESENGEI